MQHTGTSEQKQAAATLTPAPSTIPGSSELKALPTRTLERELDVLTERFQTSSLDSPKPETLQEKPGSEWRRKIQYQYASTYRKIFALIFTVNLGVFVALMVAHQGQPELSRVGDAASANLLACVLFRQEDFVNLVYEAAVAAPHAWPLGVRRRLAKVFHYGGCHSGAGTAAAVWYALYTGLATRAHLRRRAPATLLAAATSWVVLAMFAVILGSAHPRLRRRCHDRFEALHRLAGWAALASFWVHALAAAAGGAAGPLARSPSFWCLAASTACTLLSWARLRRRGVRAERLSAHAVRLHFGYRSMAPFYGVRLSTSPLREWHAFATIPEAGGGGFSVVVGNAGDWTRGQIEKTAATASEEEAQERKLWVRGAPLHGLLYTSKLFRRVVLVATGSGIGPCLSLLFADATPCRVLWSTRDPRATYGAAVVDAVLRADPRAVIWNTSAQGYPDMVRETCRLVEESGAEAVYIISNPRVTQKVVFGLQTRGVPAYGAIFDS
ncbi:hypothetical protein F4780DRAFT_775230 [Xylariomycetidae sp. FL0641]|nr:hypothetical protein F4780DRAFT_775230 [Xylariomycetidae sp. FL0641]